MRADVLGRGQDPSGPVTALPDAEIDAAVDVPNVQFHSEAYTADLLRQGGDLHGRLRMHGIERREKFILTPAQCARPGRDCPIIVQGTVQRGDYDLDGWRMALRDDVRFALKVRLRDVEGAETP